MLKAGYFQNSPEFGQIKKNVDYVFDKLSNVKNALIVLPELFATGYNIADKTELKYLSEEKERGYTFEAMSYLSKKNDLTIVYGFAEKDKDKFFNSSALIHRGKLKGLYRKIHLFYKEKTLFSEGDLGFNVFEIENGIKLGLMICFDWIYPESARTLSLKGAHIICHSTNLVLPYCPDASVTRALENRVFIIVSNRIGVEKRNGENFKFIGKSEIVTPKGEILGRADENEEKLFLTEINPFEAENKNLNELNNLFLDRKPEFYFN